jgi:hypothetical protein
MRDTLVKRYYELSHKRSNLVNPQACGIRKEMLTHPDVLDLDKQIQQVCDELASPANRVQPKDEWERIHGVWLLVAMPDHSYLPGELLKIKDSTQTYDGTKLVNAVIAEKMHGHGRYIVLTFDASRPYEFYGCEHVSPGPFLM